MSLSDGSSLVVMVVEVAAWMCCCCCRCCYCLGIACVAVWSGDCYVVWWGIYCYCVVYCDGEVEVVCCGGWRMLCVVCSLVEGGRMLCVVVEN